MICRPCGPVLRALSHQPCPPCSRREVCVGVCVCVGVGGVGVGVGVGVCVCVCYISLVLSSMAVSPGGAHNPGTDCQGENLESVCCASPAGDGCVYVQV